MSSERDSQSPSFIDDRALQSQSMTPRSMEALSDSFSYLHFALIYIDQGGKLRFEASPSIANSCQTILSPNVTETFLRAVAISNKNNNKFLDPSLSLVTITDHTRAKSPSQSPDMEETNELTWKLSMSGLSARQNNTWQYDERRFQSHTDGHQAKRKRVSHECVVPMTITCNQRAMLPIRNWNLLRKYYEKAFESLQQINCRILAKAYIKLVEPRKQVNYPYNGRKIISGTSQQLDPELTKPTWWPSGVTHREPDHLLKAERVRLLVHILCELRNSHGITVGKLKEADQSIRRQILPIERLEVLDEIYRVREEEEDYIDGRTDEQAVVSVSRVHLPDVVEAQGVGTPTTSIMNPDLNPVYKKEVPDLESHTSVFQSTGNLSTANTDKESGKRTRMIHTNWDPCPPTSLPSLNTSKRVPHGENTYCLDVSSTSMFHHGSPPVSLDPQLFPLKYYNDSHLPHHQQQQPVPVMELTGTDLGSCTNPYYFNY